MPDEIVMVDLELIDANPFRLIEQYPYVERKIEALLRSYLDVGCWPGIIARYAGNRYQIAFGHHRVEAARRMALNPIPIILRNLSDEQMLQFMGRENMEDYNADFLCMLETWEAAIRFHSSTVERKTQPLDIARLLGWITTSSNSSITFNNTARACAAAHSLIHGGYLTRDDLVDLSVKAAREIVERAQSRVEQLEVMAKKTKRPRKEIEEAKAHVGKAAATTASQYRRGEHGLGHKDLRGRVDVNAYRFAKDAKRQSPLFAAFGVALCGQIARIAYSDSIANKFQIIREAIGEIEFEEDLEIVRRVAFECKEASGRLVKWHKAFDKPRDKVVKMHVREVGGPE